MNVTHVNTIVKLFDPRQTDGYQPGKGAHAKQELFCSQSGKTILYSPQGEGKTGSLPPLDEKAASARFMFDVGYDVGTETMTLLEQSGLPKLLHRVFAGYNIGVFSLGIGPGASKAKEEWVQCVIPLLSNLYSHYEQDYEMSLSVASLGLQDTGLLDYASMEFTTSASILEEKLQMTDFAVSLDSFGDLEDILPTTFDKPFLLSFQFALVSRQDPERPILTPTFCFGDLGAFETNVFASSANISTDALPFTLKTLKNVAMMLNQPFVSAAIPYHQNHITSLISEFFGGNGQTCLLLSVNAFDVDEKTFSGLQFGELLRNIKNRPSVTQEDVKVRQLARLEASHAHLSSLEESTRLKYASLLEAYESYKADASQLISSLSQGKEEAECQNLELAYAQSISLITELDMADELRRVDLEGVILAGEKAQLQQLQDGLIRDKIRMEGSHARLERCLADLETRARVEQAQAEETLQRLEAALADKVKESTLLAQSLTQQQSEVTTLEAALQQERDAMTQALQGEKSQKRDLTRSFEQEKQRLQVTHQSALDHLQDKSKRVEWLETELARMQTRLGDLERTKERLEAKHDTQELQLREALIGKARLETELASLQHMKRLMDKQTDGQGQQPRTEDAVQRMEKAFAKERQLLERELTKRHQDWQAIGQSKAHLEQELASVKNRLSMIQANQGGGASKASNDMDMDADDQPAKKSVNRRPKAKLVLPVVQDSTMEDAQDGVEDIMDFDAVHKPSSKAGKAAAKASKQATDSQLDLETLTRNKSASKKQPLDVPVTAITKASATSGKATGKKQTVTLTKPVFGTTGLEAGGLASLMLPTSTSAASAGVKLGALGTSTAAASILSKYKPMTSLTGAKPTAQSPALTALTSAPLAAPKAAALAQDENSSYLGGLNFSFLDAPGTKTKKITLAQPAAISPTLLSSFSTKAPK